MYSEALGKYIRGRSTRDAHIERNFHIKNRARFGHNVYEILDLISGERKNSIFSLPKCVVVVAVVGGRSEKLPTLRNSFFSAASLVQKLP